MRVSSSQLLWWTTVRTSILAVIFGLVSRDTHLAAAAAAPAGFHLSASATATNVVPDPSDASGTSSPQQVLWSDGFCESELLTTLFSIDEGRAGGEDATPGPLSSEDMAKLGPLVTENADLVKWILDAYLAPLGRSRRDRDSRTSCTAAAAVPPVVPESGCGGGGGERSNDATARPAWFRRGLCWLGVGPEGEGRGYRSASSSREDDQRPHYQSSPLQQERSQSPVDSAGQDPMEEDTPPSTSWVVKLKDNFRRGGFRGCSRTAPEPRAEGDGGGTSTSAPASGPAPQLFTMPPPRCSLWSLILQNKSALWDDLFIRGLPFAETKLGQLADFLLLQSPQRFAAYVLQAMFLHDDHSGAGKAGTNRFYQSLSADQADKANAWLLAELKRLTEAVEAEDVVVETVTDHPERSATSSSTRATSASSSAGVVSSPVAPLLLSATSAAAERKETRAFVRDVVVRLSLQYWGKFLLDRDYSQLLHPTDAMVSRIVRATPAKTVAEIKESILEPYWQACVESYGNEAEVALDDVDDRPRRPAGRVSYLEGRGLRRCSTTAEEKDENSGRGAARSCRTPCSKSARCRTRCCRTPSPSYSRNSGAFDPSYATSSSPAGKNTAPYPFCSGAKRDITEQCNGDVDAFELNLVKTSIAAPPNRLLSIRSASFTLLEDEVPEVVPPSPPTSMSSSSGLSTQLENFAGPRSSAYSSVFAPSTASGRAGRCPSSPPSDIDQLYLRTHYSAGSLLKDVVDVFGTTFPGADPDGETAQQHSPRREDVEPQRPTNFEIWRQIRDSAAERYLTATARLKDFLTAEMKRRTFHLRKEAREKLGTVWYLYNPRPGAVSGLFSEAGYREMEDLLVLFERFGPASHSSYRMLKKPSKYNRRPAESPTTSSASQSSEDVVAAPNGGDIGDPTGVVARAVLPFFRLDLRASADRFGRTVLDAVPDITPQDEELSRDRIATRRRQLQHDQHGYFTPTADALNRGQPPRRYFQWIPPPRGAVAGSGSDERHEADAGAGVEDAGVEHHHRPHPVPARRIANEYREMAFKVLTRVASRNDLVDGLDQFRLEEDFERAVILEEDSWRKLQQDQHAASSTLKACICGGYFSFGRQWRGDQVQEDVVDDADYVRCGLFSPTTIAAARSSCTEDVRMTPSMRDILYLARRHRVFREGIEAIADPEGGRWAHWNSQVATGRKEMWTVVYLHLKFADHLGPLASTLAHKYWQWFGTGGCAPASAAICRNNDEYGRNG